MFKVIIINPTCEESPWSGTFETFDKASAWLESSKKKPGRTPDVAKYEGPIDLSQDISFLKEDIKNKRLREYPCMEETVEAMFESMVEGKSQKLEEIMIKRSEVNKKYPLPERLEIKDV